MTAEQHIKNNLFMQERIDNSSNVYKNFKLKIPLEAIFCLNGVNKVFEGHLRIVIRQNNTTYGSQVYFQFWIQKELQQYKANSPHNNIEYYINSKEDVKDLFEAILEELK